MLVFNTLFKHIKLLLLHFKGFAFKLKNAALYFIKAFLSFAAFSYSILLIFLKKSRRTAAQMPATIRSRIGPAAGFAFKTIFLTVVALLFTATVKTYFFQKIMASEMLKMIGGEVAVAGVELGLAEFSHDSVSIRGLSHTAKMFSFCADRIEVAYDFMESMKDRAKINILTFKKPEFAISDFKSFVAELFASKETGIKNYDFLFKLPKISIESGALRFADDRALENLDCEITPLTDYIIFIKSRAGFKNSDCTLELGVTVNFETGTVKYNGRLLSAGLERMERFLNAFAAGGAITDLKGFADCEFSGSFCAADGGGVSALKFKPRGCEFALAKAPGGRIAVRSAEASVALKTNYFDVSDYEISVRGAKLVFGGREFDLDGTLAGGASEFRISSPKLGAADIEPFVGPLPGFLASLPLPGFGVELSLKNGHYEAGITVEPFSFPVTMNLPEIKATGGKFLLRGSVGAPFAEGFGSLEGGLTLCTKDGETVELRVSSRAAREFYFEAPALATGTLSIKNGGSSLEAAFERTPLAKTARAKSAVNITIDLSTLRFDARLAGVGAEEISYLAAFLGCRTAAFPVGLLRVYDATLSGYIERDRLIAHYSASVAQSQTRAVLKNSRIQTASPLIAGVFSAANSSDGFSFNLKAAGNLADAVELSGHDNYRLFQLVRKKIFNQNTVVSFSAAGGRPSRLTIEAPLLTIDYLFDGKLAVEYKYGGFLTMNGTYHIAETRFTASARLAAEKIPAPFAVAVKYLGVSEFGVDYTGGLLKISSAAGGKKGALYFELNGAGISNIANSKLSLNNVIIETADFSYNGTAGIDFNSMTYALNGKLVLTGAVKDIAFVKSVIGGFSVGLTGSFRDYGAGEKPQMRIKLKSDPILSAVRFIADFKVVLDEGVRFEELKLTDAAGTLELARATAELKRDSVSGANCYCYHVLYKSEKVKEFLLSLKKNASAVFELYQSFGIAGQIKTAELEKLLEMVESGVAAVGLTGSLVVKNAALESHEFELSVGLKNGMKLSASFAPDGAKGVYRTKLMNYSFAGVTYKGECLLDFAAAKASVRFDNVKMSVADALELVTGEKNDINGIMTADSLVSFDKGLISLESKLRISNAKIDAEKLGKLFLYDQKGNAGDMLNLNVDISLGESCYVYNQSLYALVEGALSVKGTPSTPLISGFVDIVRGKINYLNRSFNIDSGGFKLSTLKNVSKVMDRYQNRDSVSPKEADASDGVKTTGPRAGALKYSFRLDPAVQFNHGSQGKSAIELSTNITASTKVDDYQIYLTIAAGLNRLNAYLTSKPELSSESIHMLLYGVKPDAASASGGGEQLTPDKFIDVINNQLQDAIYQKLSDSLEKKLNLDEVRINAYTAGGVTSLGGRIGGKSAGQNELLRNFGHYTDVEVKIGKYIDPALFLSYSKNLYSSRSDSLGMEYKVRKKFFVDGRVNQNLEYRLGAKYGIPF